MKKGGRPPSWKNTPKNTTKRKSIETLNKEFLEGKYTYRPTPPEPQPIKSGLSQIVSSPKSPFTGPGPSTAGKRRRRTRRVKRRS